MWFRRTIHPFGTVPLIVLRGSVHHCSVHRRSVPHRSVRSASKQLESGGTENKVEEYKIQYNLIISYQASLRTTESNLASSLVARRTLKLSLGTRCSYSFSSANHSLEICACSPLVLYLRGFWKQKPRHVSVNGNLVFNYSTKIKMWIYKTILWHLIKLYLLYYYFYFQYKQ